MTETSARPCCSRFLRHPLALAALAAVSGAAWGQDAAAPAAAAAPPAAAASAAARAADTLDAVYVTANRRREKAASVAGSVNVLSGEQLEQRGVTSIDEVAGYVPGLQVTGDSPGTQKLSIRGITTGSQMVGNTVATYLDEQPVSLSNSIAGGSAIMNDVDPLDLARIEVLKGPQGSLYGASAFGGVVKYVTVQPDLRELEGRAEVGVSSRRGNTGASARAAVNVPLVQDLLAVRVTAYTRTDPGYVEDTLRGRKNVDEFRNEGARIAALLKPSAAFDAKLVLDTQTLRSDDAAVPQYDAASLQPLYGDFGARRALAQPMKNGFDRAALTLNYDMGFASLLSVSSYAHIRNDTIQDSSDYARFLDFASAAGYAQAGLPVTALNPAAAQTFGYLDTTKKVQEFRLTSPGGGRFDWLAGIFFQDEQLRGNVGMDFFSAGNLATPSTRFLDGALNTRLRETAAYLNATVHLSERFDVQGGLRYASIAQDYAVDSQVYNYLTAGLLALPTNAVSTKERPTTWMLSPRWTLDRDQMVYFRAASGYRPGGPNVPDALGHLPAPLKSDSIVNYELGYKAYVPALKLDLAAALFRIDWKDIQLTATDATSGTKYYANGGKARSQGLELEAGWRPAEGLRLSAALSAMQARLTEDVAAVGGLSGDDIPFTPKLSASLAADYGWALGGGRMSIGASLRHVGRRSVTFSHEPAAPLVPTVASPTLPAYDLLDLRASCVIERWMVSLFLKNALDRRVPINYNGNQVVMNLQTGGSSPADVGVAPPRTIGLSLRADF